MQFTSLSLLFASLALALAAPSAFEPLEKRCANNGGKSLVPTLLIYLSIHDEAS